MYESRMANINMYDQELTKKDIEQNKHREFVGGSWEEIGQLQANFMIKQGLKPFHKLADIGCGCLRGGIPFIQYLDVGKYYGLDLNHSLIEAGIHEIKANSLEGKQANLLVDDQFRLSKFKEKFDFMISISVFTHLPFNVIVRCLTEVKRQLAPEGVYFSSFFQAPLSANIESITHQPGGVTTHYDLDPFHYSFEEISCMASLSGLHVSLIGDWGHPKNQRMVAFKERCR
jgi:SAM-dependent methyltransferase